MPAFLFVGEKDIFFFLFRILFLEGLLLGGSVTFLTAFCFAAFIFESSASLAYTSTSLSVDLILSTFLNANHCRNEKLGCEMWCTRMLSMKITKSECIDQPSSSVTCYFSLSGSALYKSAATAFRFVVLLVSVIVGLLLNCTFLFDFLCVNNAQSYLFGCFTFLSMPQVRSHGDEWPSTIWCCFLIV